MLGGREVEGVREAEGSWNDERSCCAKEFKDVLGGTDVEGFKEAEGPRNVVEGSEDMLGGTDVEVIEVSGSAELSGELLRTRSHSVHSTGPSQHRKPSHENTPSKA